MDHQVDLKKWVEEEFEEAKRQSRLKWEELLGAEQAGKPRLQIRALQEEVSHLGRRSMQWADLNIALARQQAGPTGTESEPLPRGRELVAHILSRKLPSPSTYARDAEWSEPKLAGLLGLMRTHRPAHIDGDGLIQGDRFQQLPVALLDPILAQVEEDCACATPEARDSDLASMLSQSMSGSFASEEARRAAFCRLLQKDFGIRLERHYARDGLTDGTALISDALTWAFPVNVVVKLDIGTGGGDPRIQNCACAALLVCDSDRRHLRELCRCPMLLMELAGPNLSLSGFAFGQHCCCDQLSHTVSLLWQPKSELMLSAARVVHAIRKAWPALRAFYSDIPKRVQQLSEGIDLQLDYPHPRTCTPLAGGDTWRFSYVQRVSDYTFLATEDSSEGRLFVKFCKRYSVEAHVAMAAAGFAAKLLSVEKLPGRWLMVVMELLEGACTWDATRDKPRPVDDLRAAVAALHAAGFVHGDLRDCNVLVQNGKVFLIDFEWAGRAGEARYPLYMNRVDLQWPEGASDNRLITVQHDLWWMNELLSA